MRTRLVSEIHLIEGRSYDNNGLPRFIRVPQACCSVR